MRTVAALVCLSVASLGLAAWAAAQEHSANADATAAATPTEVATNATPSTAPHPAAAPRATSSAAKDPAAPHTDVPLRIEGERRFRANCGRCHNAPRKFPPRVMAAVVRHMRVRAAITDEDMRYILAYVTQ